MYTKMVYNEKQKSDINNNDNCNNNVRTKPTTHQISRKEPNINNIKVNESYSKKISDKMDSEDDMNYMDDLAYKSSFSAVDSLRKNRKSVSRGNSRNNLRINNKNCYDYSNYNDASSNNRNSNNYDNERSLCCEQTSNNSIPNSINDKDDDKLDDNNNDEINYESENNNNNSSVPGIKVIPRNEVNNNDDEQFNELFINKEYIIKKFDKMMDDLGLTTEGRMTLMNLSLEKKWEIFKMQKDKMNVECNNPSIDPNSTDNSPKRYISLLKKKNVNSKLLTKLRFMISDDSSNWLTNFIKLGGYYHLNKYLMDVVMKDSKSNKDWVIHEHLLRCIRSLFHSRIGLETLYSDPTPLLLLTLSLFYHQLIHIKKDVTNDNSVQSLFLSSPSVLPLPNRVLILDMLTYLTKIETPLGWNMVVDSLHWVSLGNGDKNVYIEDINNRLELSKEKYKQAINSKKTLKSKNIKSFNFSSLTNISIHKSSILSIPHKAKSFRNGNDKNKDNSKLNNEPSLINNASNSNNLNVLFSDLFTDELSFHLAFTLLQEEYQLQGYQDFNKEFSSSSSHFNINTQNSNSDISSCNTESNSSSYVDLNQDDTNKQNASQSKHQAALTFPRNRKINIYSQNNNENNLKDISSTATSVPNLKSINSRRQSSKDSCSYTERNSSYYNLDNSQYTSCNLSESTIANNSVNYLNSNYNLNDNESELRKYSVKRQHSIKKVQTNSLLFNNVNNKNPYANVPKFCPFTFWMKDFEDCAKEYNQLFLGNNLSSKIIFNTIANKTYRWAPMVSTPKETVDQEQAINYISTNLHLLLSILENVPCQTAQNRLAIIKCLRLCRIEKVFQKLSQSKNTDILNLINQCIQKDLAKNLEDFSLSIFQSKDHYSIYGTIQKNKDGTSFKNLSRKILVKKKKYASVNNIDNLDLDFNKNGYNLTESCTIYNKELSSNNIDDIKNNTNTYDNLNSYKKSKFKLGSSLKQISSSFNSLKVADSCDTVVNDMNNKHMSVAHKSQVIGRSHARRIKMN